jgi:CRP-like cAMP-binding protein
LKDLLGQSPGLQRQLLHYAHVLGVQTTSTALANGRFKLEPRLARWLLMCHDRTVDDELPTTHQFLSLMLGVNRTSLTAVVARFERSGFIETRRGALIVRDRPGLLVLAGASYGVPETEYARLLGQSADNGSDPSARGALGG